MQMVSSEGAPAAKACLHLLRVSASTTGHPYLLSRPFSGAPAAGCSAAAQPSSVLTLFLLYCILAGVQQAVRNKFISGQ